MRVVVLVPYRAGGGHRDRLWRHLRDNYWALTTYPLFVGGDDADGPFNRSAAINAAAAAAGDWDAAVIADSDTWVPQDRLAEAVRVALDTGRLVSALTGVAELDARFTADILSGSMTMPGVGLERVRSGELDTQSSMLVVPRPLWDAIGGFDERFCGWGGEDNAFWRAATILGGAPHRIPGYAYHLWHEPALPAADRGADNDYRANLTLWNRYRVARNERMLRDAQRVRRA